MKKYIILIVVTVLAVITIFVTGGVTEAAAEAEGYTVQKSDCESIVTVSGRLQYMKDQKVSRQNYCMTDKIFVSDGDQVKKGDPLLTVYEVENLEQLTASFPEAEKYLALLTKSEIGEEIAAEIRQYAVRYTINAPSDGTVTSLAYGENNFVNKNNVILRIADTREPCIKVNVGETYIEKIKAGQKVRIRFTASDEKQYSGTVLSIAGQAKQSASLTGKETVVEVVIVPDEPLSGLRIGYTTECEIVTSVEKNILRIPYEYLNSDEEGEYVFISRNHKAKKVYVQTGKEFKNGVEITKGLHAGDRIIRSAEVLSDGQWLKEGKEGQDV